MSLESMRFAVGPALRAPPADRPVMRGRRGRLPTGLPGESACRRGVFRQGSFSYGSTHNLIR